jgi:hypothetical protein
MAHEHTTWSEARSAAHDHAALRWEELDRLTRSRLLEQLSAEYGRGAQLRARLLALPDHEEYLDRQRPADPEPGPPAEPAAVWPGLVAGALYWDERGAIACGAHTPYPGTDSWMFDAWALMPADVASEPVPELGGDRPHCEVCGLEASSVPCHGQLAAGERCSSCGWSA